jgi:HSP20 family protein
MAELTHAPKGQAEVPVPESTRDGTQFIPRVDIVETKNELTVFADLPGVRQEDVDLRFEQGELILRGRVRPEERGRNHLLQEYGVGDFYRAFTVHETIDAGKISAECKNGVLTIHLPKVTVAQPRQIKVSGS